MAEVRLIAPQPGPQTALCQCPVEDLFFGGVRGGGKSQGLLIDGVVRQNRWGPFFRGIILRRTYLELEELIAKAQDIYIAAGARWHGTNKTFTFPKGGTIKFRYLERDVDAERYQGHEYTWIAVDEAGNFKSPAPIDRLRATLRSPAGVPCVLRLTGNPGGIGHNWLKKRYIDPAPPMTVHRAPLSDDPENDAFVSRVFIPSSLKDNKILLNKDPDYASRIMAATADRPDLRKAWLLGLWDIKAGGAFNDLWDNKTHVIKPFDVPSSWYIDRSFDWGSSKPWAVGWWAESDGTEAVINGEKRKYPPKTLFLIGELYGWTGKENEGDRRVTPEIAREILRAEKIFPWGSRVRPGPADPSIYTRTDEVSYAEKMEMAGVRWLKGDSAPGSRIQRVEAMRHRLSASRYTPLEDAGIYIVETCRQWLRTVPDLPRDEKKPDDVDTDQEDHMWDMTGYRLMQRRHTQKMGYTPMR